MAGEKKRKSQPDWLLLVSALLLTAIGIIMVFSSSQYFAQYYPYYDTFYFLKRQLRNMLVGLVFMLLAALALGEMLMDKTPFVPARIMPGPLSGRMASGALVGAAPGHHPSSGPRHQAASASVSWESTISR